ncbi:MAG: L,D-transpeptidase family protein [Nitrospirae bacterium]|nr:L,D-transpeptidase family protein [Nitrospirota bacterium]
MKSTLLILVMALCYFQSPEVSGGTDSSLPSRVVAKSVLSVRYSPSPESDEVFQLFPGMDFIPRESIVQDGTIWYRIRVGYHNYWVEDGKVESGVNGQEGPSLPGNHVPEDDYKIVVDKARRAMYLYEGEKLKKTYEIGLSFVAGQKVETKPIKSGSTYLIITESGRIKAVPTIPSSGFKGIEAIVEADRQKKTLTAYYPSYDILGKGEIYPIDRRIIVNNYSVWFDYDHFNVVSNKDISPKERAQDKRTPEGVYFVATIKPNSKYGIDPDTRENEPSLLLSYPNQYDAWRGLKKGLIGVDEYVKITIAIENGKVPLQNTPLGNFIMIHGGGNTDWTAGCIALSNSDFKDLLRYVHQGMIVEIM